MAHGPMIEQPPVFLHTDFIRHGELMSVITHKNLNQTQLPHLCMDLNASPSLHHDLYTVGANLIDSSAALMA